MNRCNAQDADIAHIVARLFIYSYCCKFYLLECIIIK